MSIRWKSINTKVVDEAVELLRLRDGLDVNRNAVKDAVGFYTWFIGNVIAEGAFESVRIPYFGIFTPKPRQIIRREVGKRIPNPKRNKAPQFSLPDSSTHDQIKSGTADSGDIDWDSWTDDV